MMPDANAVWGERLRRALGEPPWDDTVKELFFEMAHAIDAVRAALDREGVQRDASTDNVLDSRELAATLPIWSKLGEYLGIGPKPTGGGPRREG